MRILLIFIFLGFSSVGFSAGGAPCGHYLSENGTSEGQCDDAKVDPTDLASLQRGAQTYVNYCL